MFRLQINLDLVYQHCVRGLIAPGKLATESRGMQDGSHASARLAADLP